MLKRKEKCELIATLHFKDVKLSSPTIVIAFHDKMPKLLSLTELWDFQIVKASNFPHNKPESLNSKLKGSQ